VSQAGYGSGYQYFRICKTRLLETTIDVSADIRFYVFYFTTSRGSETAWSSHDRNVQLTREIDFVFPFGMIG